MARMGHSDVGGVPLGVANAFVRYGLCGSYAIGESEYVPKCVPSRGRWIDITVRREVIL